MLRVFLLVNSCSFACSACAFTATAEVKEQRIFSFALLSMACVVPMTFDIFRMTIFSRNVAIEVPWERLEIELKGNNNAFDVPTKLCLQLYN